MPLYVFSLWFLLLEWSRFCSPRFCWKRYNFTDFSSANAHFVTCTKCYTIVSDLLCLKSRQTSLYQPFLLILSVFPWLAPGVSLFIFCSFCTHSVSTHPDSSPLSSCGQARALSQFGYCCSGPSMNEEAARTLAVNCRSLHRLCLTSALCQTLYASNKTNSSERKTERLRSTTIGPRHVLSLFRPGTAGRDGLVNYLCPLRFILC